MIISRPFKNFDIIVLSELLTKEELADVKKNGEYVEGDESVNWAKLDKKVQKIKKKIYEQAKLAIVQEFSDLKNLSFTPFDKFSRYIQKGPGVSMPVHVDGVPELGADEQPENIGSIFYVNDNFGGGETYYPKINVSYKPVSGTMIAHRGLPEYEHGVREVTGDVTRLTLGLFAFNNLKNIENYNVG